jgi:S-adenosyl methyltransferase
MAQQFDASVPSPARIWNYWVGGKDNFEADRAEPCPPSR